MHNWGKARLKTLELKTQLLFTAEQENAFLDIFITI